MKRSSLWVTSIVVLLVATTFAFQNCNNKKFATTASSQVKGSLDSMNTSGQITGEVHSNLCDEESEIQSGQCPTSGIIKFYAIGDDGSKTFIGTTEANLQEVDNGGVKSYKYIFSFIVPQQYDCDDIEAYAVDPQSGAEVLITPDAGFILWGDQAHCTGGGTNGGGNNGSNNGGSTNNTVSGTFDATAHQDGRLVEVDGSCSGSVSVVASGDFNSFFSKTDSCTSGAYKHCDLLAKPSATNTVVETQGANSKSLNLTAPSAVLVLTVNSLSIDADNKMLHLAGDCTPNGQITLNIYSAQKASFTCPANGSYTYSGSILVPTLTDRDLISQLDTLSGSVKIHTNVDLAATPVCSITSTVAHGSNICTAQAGSVKGACVPKTPVILSVNGTQQNFAVCADNGTYQIDNVLLQKLGDANTVSVKQVNPKNGSSCNPTKSMTTF